MIEFISFLSGAIIPIMILYIVGMGLLSKVNIFDVFARGAMDGLKMVVKLTPTLIGLLVAVGMFRESGLLSFLCEKISGIVEVINFPVELVPLSVVKMVSSSAANGLLFDIFEEFGCDSFLGLSAGIIMCSTETILYCISVYFSATSVTKTRWTLVGGLAANVAGIVASVIIAGKLIS